MSVEGYLDTRGKQYLAIAICDRCKRKFPIEELHSDPNSPALKVCADDLDVLDPWREPTPAPEQVALMHPRPDEPLS